MPYCWHINNIKPIECWATFDEHWAKRSNIDSAKPLTPSISFPTTFHCSAAQFASTANKRVLHTLLNTFRLASSITLYNVISKQSNFENQRCCWCAIKRVRLRQICVVLYLYVDWVKRIGLADGNNSSVDLLADGRRRAQSETMTKLDENIIWWAHPTIKSIDAIGISCVRHTLHPLTTQNSHLYGRCFCSHMCAHSGISNAHANAVHAYEWRRDIVWRLHKIVLRLGASLVKVNMPTSWYLINTMYGMYRSGSSANKSPREWIKICIHNVGICSFITEASRHEFCCRHQTGNGLNVSTWREFASAHIHRRTPCWRDD